MLRIGTGSATGFYYPLGNGIAQILNSAAHACQKKAVCALPPLLAVAQLSGGSKANVESLARNATELGLVQADIAYAAYSGDVNFGFDIPYTCLRVISNLYPEYLHVIVHRDSDIKTISDLRGRRVALNDPGSGTLQTARQVLDAAAITEAELEPLYLQSDMAVQEFIEGRIDAFFMVMGAPAKALLALSSHRPIRLVPITESIAKQVTRRQPYLIYESLPASTYADIGEVKTLAVAAQLIAHAELDEDLVYELSQLLWRYDTLTSLTKIQPDVYLGTALSGHGLALPLHPGALRHFQERGLAKALSPIPNSTCNTSVEDEIGFFQLHEYR